MPSVNIERTPSETRIYDKFNNLEVVANSGDYDLVNSFFKNIMQNDQLADEFTAQVFIMSKKTGLTPTQYLDSVKGQDSQSLTMSMAYYLNQTRSNSALLGVGSVLTPNYYAARNVVS